MNVWYTAKISRRTTLRWLTAVMAASTISPHPFAYSAAQEGKTSKGYGADPDLLNPTVPWQRTFSPQQLQLTAVLADLILPASETAPAPSALGIPEFVDEWVSAPYPEQMADRAMILSGFERLEAQARRRYSEGFLQITDAQRRAIVDTLVSPDMAMKPDGIFFYRFRFIVVGAYYTTAEGFKDIGYIGNVPLAAYPGVTDAERSILETELKKLGI